MFYKSLLWILFQGNICVPIYQFYKWYKNAGISVRICKLDYYFFEIKMAALNELNRIEKKFSNPLGSCEPAFSTISFQWSNLHYQILFFSLNFSISKAHVEIAFAEVFQLRFQCCIASIGRGFCCFNFIFRFSASFVLKRWISR